MPYDFETVIDRRQTNSIKWDVKANELPMWIADMDFKTAPAITAALEAKAAFGIYGYEDVPTAYFEAVADWWASEHHFRPELASMMFCTGVVPAISSIVRKMSAVGDNVLVQAPVYNIFYHSIENNGRHTLSSDLIYQDGQYTIDFDDLATKLADPLTTMMIVCNPHNPIGIVWSRDTLQRIGELCLQNHVLLVADEIHADLALNGNDYTPVASLSPDVAANTVSCVSPSKTFNVAALHAATLIIPDATVRARVSRGINNDELAEPNAFAVPGSIAAYRDGHEWVAALREKLAANQRLLQQFIKTELPAVHVIEAQATYLIWLDISAVADDASELADFIRQQTGLFLSAGDVYRGDGHQFLRMNIACPTSMLQDGLNRLATGINAYQAK
ncbi:MalY/PatB family protein [Lactiplantibacillus fabifermentans]|uniref:cysteine-S-conjugate beta-lyase n=2 Tax=Lactiplantibacillus fabifermentans TaxID=483011 RepID=A0A0R2NH37_9LACO|nr:MalY/PatB family protein [Lactiplantibacillus fabifermentans]ETY73308.1 plastocyanin [Lactiplantibacillus fabifermentans T30PCM01]KRO25134.1 aminotransferase [Lactiplantibacillus fabifermentans DSM 21115]